MVNDTAHIVAAGGSTADLESTVLVRESVLASVLWGHWLP